MRRVLRWLAVAAPLTVVVLLGWAFALGALAETPAEPGPAPVVQVIDEPDLGRHVRAMVKVPYSVEEVWQVLTDHDRYGDICPYLHRPNFEPDPARTTRLTGRIQGLANTFPLDVELHHEQDLNEYRATWDTGDADVPVNRGRWTVRRLGHRESVIEVAVAVEVRGVPTFLVRLILRDRLRTVVTNVLRRLPEVAGGW
jgi:hypothetical protein